MEKNNWFSCGILVCQTDHIISPELLQKMYKPTNVGYYIDC